jgi:hypothetical protein
MPVSASGENARALLDGDADLVLPVDVVGREGDEPQPSSASAASRIGPVSSQLALSGGSPRKRVCEAGEAVRHRASGPKFIKATAPEPGSPSVGVEHVRAVGREASSSERPGEARARSMMANELAP